jgi:hypothetical protein
MPSPRAETSNPGKTRRSAGRRHTRPYTPNLVFASSVGSVTTSYQIRPVGYVESNITSRASAPKRGFETAPDAWLVFDARRGPSAPPTARRAEHGSARLAKACRD